MRPSRFLTLFLLAFMSSLSASEALASAHVVTFGIAGSYLTEATGVNRSGAVAGFYFDDQGESHGYVRNAAGTITTFDVPGASVGGEQGTFAWVINDAGEVAGTYSTSLVSFHGFLRDAAGNFTTFDVPGETMPGFDFGPQGINSAGQIVGISEGSATEDVFIRQADGTFTIFTPGGGSSAYVGINSLGEVAGTYAVSSIFHGFYRDTAGNITTFAVPGASNGTWAYSINDSGVIAGFWADANLIGYGYLRTPAGTVETYDVPEGTTFGAGTYINDSGVIASSSYDSSSSTWTPFIRSHAGNFTTFGVFNSKEAIVHGINRSGQVCGTFVGPKGIGYGFLRTP
jgi:hypothetical protein